MLLLEKNIVLKTYGLSNIIIKIIIFFIKRNDELVKISNGINENDFLDDLNKIISKQQENYITSIVLKFLYQILRNK